MLAKERRNALFANHIYNVSYLHVVHNIEPNSTDVGHILETNSDAPGFMCFGAQSGEWGGPQETSATREL